MAAYRQPPAYAQDSGEGVGDVKDPSSFVELQEKTDQVVMAIKRLREMCTQQRLGKCLRFYGLESRHLLLDHVGIEFENQDICKLVHQLR